MLQTKNLSPKKSMGSQRSLQTLESVGIIWESFLEEQAWGMVGLELVSRERRGRVRWQCLREPWEEKEWSKLVKGPGYHGGPHRMVEDLSVGEKPGWSNFFHSFYDSWNSRWQPRPEILQSGYVPWILPAFCPSPSSIPPPVLKK